MQRGNSLTSFPTLENSGRVCSKTASDQKPIAMVVQNVLPESIFHCLDTRKVLYTLTGMGSAALVAAVPYQSKATRFLFFVFLQRTTQYL